MQLRLEAAARKVAANTKTQLFQVVKEKLQTQAVVRAYFEHVFPAQPPCDQ
jgi:hypothetical protein